MLNGSQFLLDQSSTEVHKAAKDFSKPHFMKNVDLTSAFKNQSDNKDFLTQLLFKSTSSSKDQMMSSFQPVKINTQINNIIMNPSQSKPQLFKSNASSFLKKQTFLQHHKPEVSK